MVTIDLLGYRPSAGGLPESSGFEPPPLDTVSREWSNWHPAIVLLTTLFGRGMRYSAKQIREALGLTKETFRYWTEELPPLRRPGAPHARYDLSDMLGTAVVKRITDIGMPVGRLKTTSDDLFRLCRQANWIQPDKLTIAVHFDPDTVHLIRDARAAPLSPCLLIPLGPVIASLKSQLLAPSEAVQGNLGFAPASISRGRTS